MPTDTATIDATLRATLSDVLGLAPGRVDGFDDATGLFGAMPEFDSMSVATLLTELEDRLGILIEDDEVDGDMLESFGALKAFVAAKAART